MEHHGTNLTSVEAFRTNFLFFTLRIFQKLLWYLSNSFTLVLTICMPLLHLDSLFSTESSDTNYDWFLIKLSLISNTIYNSHLGLLSLKFNFYNKNCCGIIMFLPQSEHITLLPSYNKTNKF